MPEIPDMPSREVDSFATIPPSGDENWTGQPLPPHGFAIAGRFTVLSEIARGGMGVVYSAIDPQFRREVVVKTLNERLGDQADAIRRFDQEASITGQLQHPGIPAVFESGRLDDGRPFLAMKLVKGRTLAELLEGGRPNRSDLIPAFEQVCHAVAYAHSRRVIHRDLKPANVMVGAFGEVQVMDWGLAKVLGERTETRPTDPDATDMGGTKIHDPRTDSGGSETQTGDMLGTPAFMPPEQAAGAIDLVDERADVFGLGAILCVILTGEPPYTDRDGRAVRVMALRGKLEECTKRLEASGADPELVALARRCLSPEVADRPRNAGEVAAAVAELRRQADERARQAELDRVRAEGERERAELRIVEERARAELRAAEERKRRRVLLALAASVAGFLLLAGGSAWYTHQQARERRFIEEARDEREARVREGVGQVFDRLPELYDRGLWSQAESSLDQAMHILGEDRDAELSDRVKRTQRDTAFVRQLDEIRLKKIALVDGELVFKNALPKYTEAFRKSGFDLDAMDRGGMIRWLNESPVRVYLLAALDDWALTETDSATRKTLFDFTADATGQPWRRRLSEAWDEGKQLEKVYASIHSRERSPGLIAGVGHQLNQLGEDGSPTLQEGLRRFPSDFWLHAWLGIMDEGTVEQRIGANRAALAIRPGAATIHSNLGFALRANKDRSGAITSFREAVRLDPNDYDAHHGLGLALCETGELDGAITASLEAIRLKPTYANPHNALGVTLHDKGDLVGAIASYKEAIRLDPKFAKPHNNLGIALSDKGDLAGAIASYKEAIRLDPKLDKPHNNLGNALRAKGDLAGAIASYKEAIRLDPKFAKPHNNLGIALRAKGDLAGAIASYKEAVRLDPKDADAHYNLGIALRAKGDLAGAIASYKEAVRLDPKNANVQRGLRLTERWFVLSDRFPAIQQETDTPRSSIEAVEFAGFAVLDFQKRYSLAYHLLLHAITGDAKLMEPNRYNIACYALRLAAGDDPNDKPCEKKRLSLRKQAAECLSARLAVARKLETSAKPEDLKEAIRLMRHWLRDADLASVRDPERLAALPPEERERWEAFWADVRATLAKATAKGADKR